MPSRTAYHAEKEDRQAYERIDEADADADELPTRHLEKKDLEGDEEREERQNRRHGLPEGLAQDGAAGMGLHGFGGRPGRRLRGWRRDGVRQDGENRPDGRDARKAEAAVLVGPYGGDAEAERHDERNSHRARSRPAGVKCDSHEGRRSEQGEEEKERVRYEKRPLN